MKKDIKENYSVFVLMRMSLTASTMDFILYSIAAKSLQVLPLIQDHWIE